MRTRGCYYGTSTHSVARAHYAAISGPLTAVAEAGVDRVGRPGARGRASGRGPPLRREHMLPTICTDGVRRVARIDHPAQADLKVPAGVAVVMLPAPRGAVTGVTARAVCDIFE